MKKILLFLPLLLLTGCKASNNSSNNNNHENKDSGQNLVSVEDVSKSDFLNHFSYTRTFNSTRESDGKNAPTYTYITIFEMVFTPLRTGFVTYSGSFSIDVTLSWLYETKDNNGDPIDANKSTIVKMELSIEDWEKSKTYTKTFTTSYHATSSYDTSFKPQTEIPYGTSGKYSPSISNVNVYFSNVKATYYKNGVSGDTSLLMQSYEITIANYSTYFTVNGNRITPIDPSELFDYRVVFTINGQKCVVKRNGEYTYANPSGSVVQITNVEGFIDVYPGRVI